jgi:RNA polymerase sigma-70 factor (ECF subfamily)
VFSKTQVCYEEQVDDARLVAALQSRDEEAFRQLVERWTPVMKRVARAHVSTDASADEVVQDAWLGVVAGIEGFEGRSSLRTWTFRILTNIAKSRGVREKRAVPWSSLGPEPTVDPDRFEGPGGQDPGHWKVFPVSWPSPEESAIAADTQGQVRTLIASLPDRQRLVICLRDVHGFSSDEVCTLLEVTPANQRVLLHRARSAVRTGLEMLYAGGALR